MIEVIPLGTHKTRKNLYIEADTVHYLEVYAKEKSISVGKALDSIVTEHAREKERTTHFIVDTIVKRVTESIHNEIKNDLTRIRLGTNTADKNSQILIELLNTLLIEQNLETCISTEEFKGFVLRQAEEIVTDRIKRFRTKKLEKDFQKERNHE
jgi:hypothetical protein